MDSKKFRVVLNMNNYFHDHRSVSYILISNKMNSILDLENKISGIFGIEDFYLACENKYLPSKEDIALLDKQDVVWVIPKSLSNVEISELNKERKKVKNERRGEIKNSNNITIFSAEPVNNDSSFKHKADHFEGKIRENKKRKQKTEVSDLNEMTDNCKSRELKTDMKSCDINDDSSFVNVETYFKEQRKKAKKKKCVVENHNTNEMDAENCSQKLKTSMEDFLVPSYDMVDSKKKSKRKKKGELNTMDTLVNIEECDNVNINHNNEINNQHELAKSKSKDCIIGDIGKMNTNGNSIEPSKWHLEYTNRNGDNVIYKPKKGKDKGNAGCSTLKDSQSEGVSSYIEHTISEGDDDSVIVSYHNKMDHNDSEIRKDMKNEKKSKAVINSHFVLKPDGNVFEQAVPLDEKKTNTNMSLNNDTYNEHYTSSRFSIGRCLSDLRSQSPSSFISSEGKSPINRKRVRKRNRKNKKSVAHEVQSDLVVAQKPLIIPTKSAVHIKFDEDGNKQSCIKAEIPSKQNSNIKPGLRYLVNPIHFVPASSNEDCKELLNGSVKKSSAIQEASRIPGTEEASRIEEFKASPKQLPDALQPAVSEDTKPEISDSAKPYEIRNDILDGSLEVIKKENDLLISKNRDPVGLPEPLTQSPNNTVVVTPTVGSTICFKIFRLNNDYNPEISSNIVGNVQHYDCDTNKLILKILDGLDQCVCPTGKFHLELDADELQDEHDIKEFDWPELIEPKLYVPFQSKDS